MDAFMTGAALRQTILSNHPPLVIDVRREERFRDAPDLLRGALYRWCREGKQEVHTWNPEAYR